MTNPASLRKALRREIEDHLEGLECEPAVVEPGKLETLLNNIVAGLIALDHGEVWPVFQASLKATRVGPYPSQVRDLKIRAVAYVNALRRREDSTSPKAGKKYSLLKACEEVGLALGLADGDAVKGWRRDIIKHPIKQGQLSDDMTKLGELVRLDRGRMLFGEPSVRQASYVLEAAKLDGKMLKQLVPKGLSKPKKAKGM